MQSISLLILLLILLLLSAQSCKQATEPRLEPELALTLEDVSCTEAWMQLKTTNLQLPTTINVLKNNTVTQTFSLSTHDTLLYIDSLLPNQTYKFKVVLTNTPQPTTNELSITTMDTTSHEFSWQSWEFGECGSSSLYDVAIIDENNIWAVGEIYMRDSLGNCDPNAYNAVHWDGTKWELKRIMFYTFCPQSTGNGSYPATSIFALDNENIVISSTSQIAYLKNGVQIKRECIPVSVNKLWGSSSSDLYAVGNNGNIAHWDGVSWRKIESGTTIDLLDVWGSPNGTVWACGENIYKTVLVKIKNNLANIVFEGTYPMQQVKNRFSDGLLSLWTNNKNFIYVLSPNNLYRCENNTTGEGRELYPYNDYFKGAYLRLRATSINNLFTSGNKSTITHFNGFSWKIYDELRNEDQLLVGSDVVDNLFVTVGEKYENIFNYKGLIIVGKK
uniref:Glucosyl transferase n=1 Tax=Ignavibacterium album TaxID=591197 RepID=A0A832DEN6_9BACT